MSQSIVDPNVAPESGVGDQAATKQPTRRRRHTSTRGNAAARAEAAAATTAEAPAAAKPAEVPAPAPAAAAPQPAPAPETAETPKRPSRPRRPAGRKGGVQLVKPAGGQGAGENASATETAEAQPSEPAAQAGEPAAARVVPVTTEQAGEQVGAARVAATPLILQPAPAQEARPQRRYRFERRSAGPAVPTQPVRPERLSGALGMPAEADAGEPDVAPEVEAQPTLPDITPITSVTSARADTTRGIVDDIVSALGLSGVVEPEALAETEDEAAAETAEAAEVEGEMSTTEAEQATGTRRRRRRRRGGAHAAGAGEDEGEEHGEERSAAEAIRDAGHAIEIPESAPYLEPTAERHTRNGYEAEETYGYGYTGQQPYSPYYRPTRQAPEQAERPWDIATGQQQVREPESPFGSPEPGFARGFGPQPRGVAGPARETYQRPQRHERGTDVPPMSPNVLASTVTHAIQQQTDRLLNELRHQPQSPAMTVMFPPFPSTERIGVFVDVANLLYSARNLRTTIDFGRLLDFLRGNRRLVRAHAYAPTNPDPHADQAFLNPVKGLGYRITTKNYKTFASGAKKADMDLDLCMDIVRLVDAKAIDTVMLVSGDSDFLPLLEYCSDHGVRVEVAAFEDSAAMILRQSCDLFINLSLVEDIRA